MTLHSAVKKGILLLPCFILPLGSDADIPIQRLQSGALLSEHSELRRKSVLLSVFESQLGARSQQDASPHTSPSLPDNLYLRNKKHFEVLWVRVPA